jgi:hypothetical protein
MHRSDGYADSPKDSEVVMLAGAFPDLWTVTTANSMEHLAHVLLVKSQTGFLVHAMPHLYPW